MPNFWGTRDRHSSTGSTEHSITSTGTGIDIVPPSSTSVYSSASSYSYTSHLRDLRIHTATLDTGNASEFGYPTSSMACNPSEASPIDENTRLSTARPLLWGQRDIEEPTPVHEHPEHPGVLRAPNASHPTESSHRAPDQSALLQQTFKAGEEIIALHLRIVSASEPINSKKEDPITRTRLQVINLGNMNDKIKEYLKGAHMSGCITDRQYHDRLNRVLENSLTVSHKSISLGEFYKQMVEMVVQTQELLSRQMFSVGLNTLHSDLIVVKTRIATTRRK